MSTLCCPNCGHRLTLVLQAHRPHPSEWFLERVSRAIERRADGMTRVQVRNNFREDRSAAKAAVDELLRLGYITRSLHGAGVRYHSIKSYRAGGFR